MNMVPPTWCPECRNLIASVAFDMITSMKKHKELIYQYEAIFEPNGAGYTVTVSKLPGLVTEGDNLQHAREMAKDAIRCYLEAILKEKTLSFRKPSSRKEQIKVAA